MGILWSIGFTTTRSRVSRVPDERDNCVLNTKRSIPQSRTILS